MAWLHAAPGDDSGTKGTKKDRETRGEEFKRRFGDDCPELDLPDACGCEHIVTYLFEVGPSVRGEEITQGDLRDWQENTGPVSEFEATMLIRLSREYLGQYRKAGEKACPAPWRRERTPEEKAARAQLEIEARKARQQKK